MKRVAYIQHLDHKITFTKQELNTAYLSFADVQKVVQDKLFHLNIARVEQMGNIGYLARNRRMSQP
ncbi:MAG: hypothetical protein NZZ41_02780 [Candidatus Dojkabacteria bacterium]|nr:hypothetical protein [Candidatus Dojkabacteria bacterium]